MTLRVVPGGLEGASAAIEALVTRLAAVHAEAAPFIAAVIPPGSDPVSVQNAVGFSVHGCQHVAMAVQGIEELGRSGTGVAESGASYVMGDMLTAASYLGSGL
ncbi:PE family protein [Mycobacterium uberis]|uniref:PE family protein n=1 Tax=Mycobacterium uberis TaxID=2162698 RepID=A0A3E1HFA3_9MYCO|nr:PE family protein [Mycobacterium uberis]RFD25150.1 PE family protein [Mycobacterium uberis]